MGYIDEIIKYYRVSPPDKEQLAELIIRAKGAKRSMRQFAADCNVNPSTLSRIINKKTLGANSNELIATIADKADPDSGVTFDMLMNAHGMKLITDNSVLQIRLNIDSVKKTLYKEILERQYTLKEGDCPWLESFLGKCWLSLDLRTNALGTDSAAWLFDIWNELDDEANDLSRSSDRLKQWLLMYLGMLNVQERVIDRFSVIVTNEMLYRRVVDALDRYTFSTDISLIYINIDAGKIIDEYLVKMDKRQTREDVFYNINYNVPDSDDSIVSTDRPKIV